jgi:hypothetical protein
MSQEARSAAHVRDCSSCGRELRADGTCVCGGRCSHPECESNAAQDRGRKVYWLLNHRWLGWKVHILHGFCAWEVQIGRHVFQWFYPDSGFRERNGGAFRHWIDSYGGRHAA